MRTTSHARAASTSPSSPVRSTLQTTQGSASTSSSSSGCRGRSAYLSSGMTRKMVVAAEAATLQCRRGEGVRQADGADQSCKGNLLDRLESREGHDLCRLGGRLRLVVSLQSRRKTADRLSAIGLGRTRPERGRTHKSQLSVERALSESDRERSLWAGGVDLVTQHKVSPVPVGSFPRLETHQIAEVLKRRD